MTDTVYPLPSLQGISMSENLLNDKYLDENLSRCTVIFNAMNDNILKV
jgi:hypothetical protein